MPAMGSPRPQEETLLKAILTSFFRLLCSLGTRDGTWMGISYDCGGKEYGSPHTRGSVEDTLVGSRCGPRGIGLVGSARESQGIAAHGSPKGQPSATTDGIHHSWERREASVSMGRHRGHPCTPPHPAMAALPPPPSPPCPPWASPEGALDSVRVWGGGVPPAQPCPLVRLPWTVESG